MIVVRCIRTVEDLNRNSLLYDDFLNRIEGVSPVYRRGWIERLVDVWGLGRYHGQGANSLAFLWAERDGELIGIAPFQLEIKGILQLNLRRLYWLGEVSGSLGNDEIDFLIPNSEDRKTCIEAFVDFLMHQKTLRWDILELGLCAENSPSIELLSKLVPDSRITKEPTSVQKIELDDGFKSYFMSLSSNVRYRLKRRLRMLQDDFSNIRFSYSSHISSTRMNALINIHKNRQASVRASGGERYSLFEDPVEGKAFINLLNWADEGGIARHYWLELDDKLVAFILGFYSGHNYCYFLVAFDDTLNKYSPGKLLLRFLIENETNTFGTRCVNMMSGVNQLKRELGNKTIGLNKVVIKNPAYPSRIRILWRQIGKTIKQIPRISRH